MIRLRHKLLLHAFRAFDLVTVLGAFLILYALFSHGSLWFLLDLPYRSVNIRQGVGALLLAGGWYTIYSVAIHYDANRFTTLSTQVYALLRATSLSAFYLFVVVTLFAQGGIRNLTIFLFWLTTFAIGVLSRILLRFLLTRFRRSGMNCRHIVFVGMNPKAIDFARHVDAHPELGYRIQGFLSEKTAVAGDMAPGTIWPVLGAIGELQAVLERHMVDEVLICLPLNQYFSEVYAIIQLCRERGVVLRIKPDVVEVRLLSRSQFELFDGEYIVTFFRENLLGQLLAKRLIDLMVSTLALLILAPVFLVVALWIKLDSPGPILFAQERVGMNKRRFRLLKFRSMVTDAEARKEELQHLNEMDGPVFKIKNDPRITRIGRLLRKTSVDELPQLWNVFKGEMSLVGPRPPLPSEVDRYEWLDRKRLSIKPGITCIWQISGRNEISFEQWMELDRQYIENWSIWLDLKILLQTVPVVLFGRGAS